MGVRNYRHGLRDAKMLEGRWSWKKIACLSLYAHMNIFIRHTAALSVMYVDLGVSKLK